MHGFGAPPAYTAPAVLAAAAGSVLAGLAQFALGVAGLDLSGDDAGWWPAIPVMTVAALLFLYGLALGIRAYEARDAVRDPDARVRLYGTRRERAVYLSGLLLTLLTAALGVWWRGHLGRGWTHDLPAALALLTAYALLRQWLARRDAGEG